VSLKLESRIETAAYQRARKVIFNPLWVARYGNVAARRPRTAKPCGFK
jgi:hypothetical protein